MGQNNVTGVYTRQQQRRLSRRQQAASILQRVAAFSAVIPAGASVVDIGAGAGADVAALRRLGYPATGIDGTYKIERLSGGLVKRCDLTDPAQVGKYYRCAAWGICVEVGEHVPPPLEGVFLDNLAAIPAAA